MLTLAALAVMATLSIEGDANASIRPLQVAPQVAQTGEPVRLEDIEVTGRPLDSMILNFVEEVAAPAHRRGLARWDATVCVGVANLRNDVGQYIVDRVQTVAQDLGLETGRPGCQPNVIVMAAADADEATEELTQRRARFMMGGSGMDRGHTAFEAFQTSDEPVRWWTVSMPVDSDTGLRAVRLPGDCRLECDKPITYAPIVSTRFASRLTTQIVNEIIQTVVVVDVDQVANVSTQQLADYVSMVIFAQINPEADTSAYASVLNVFDAPETAEGLTQWDLAYLEGLYDARRTLRSTRASNREIASSIHRAHARLNSAEQ
ncbi:hypothetical protein [Brevundimonas sp. TWP2-3-2]|uniref:hypothetical protein n=1 Tax=unclassified Brevundimonas TaxID=2622653 RepID=UPI003CFB63B9